MSVLLLLNVHTRKQTDRQSGRDAERQIGLNRLKCVYKTCLMKTREKYQPIGGREDSHPPMRRWNPALSLLLAYTCVTVLCHTVNFGINPIPNKYRVIQVIAKTDSDTDADTFNQLRQLM